jgi:Fe-S-cluster containining protein
MEGLESALEAACDVGIDALAAQIQAVGFACTHCGDCCTGTQTAPHTATIFPHEVRAIQAGTGRSWLSVARPMPYGVAHGETFEWALATDATGGCVFHDADASDGGCRVHAERPGVCATYPFSLAVEPEHATAGEPAGAGGLLRVHECEGVGEPIDADAARQLARRLRERTIVELIEAAALLDRYDPRPGPELVVFDSEGPKDPQGRPLEVVDAAR